MVRTNDGFELAEVDIKLRGPGDLMGTQQSGVLNLKIANIIKDHDILQSARNYAIKILEIDPTLSKDENKILKYAYHLIGKHKNIWNYTS